MFRFHAAPLPDEWVNDPNALFFDGSTYRLFAQHSNSAPNFKTVNWGSFSSVDLVEWQWEGAVIAATPEHSIYSGSVCAIGATNHEAFYTLHNRSSGWQTQSRALAPLWADTGVPLGPEGANCRDPFVFRHASSSGWHMILAEPSDWVNWTDDEPSHLSIWHSVDRLTWQRTGMIGPWHPKGVMWEVPVIVSFGAVDALIISLVDRRKGEAECSVRYWLGKFSGKDFLPDSEFPEEGILLDLGPDFYAAIPNVAEGWPHEDRAIIAWGSNWQTAKTFAWPGNIHGGPLTMVRQLLLEDGRLKQRPYNHIEPLATRYRWHNGEPLSIVVITELASLVIELDGDGTMRAERQCEDIMQCWGRVVANLLAAPSDILVFNDAGFIEVFFVESGLVLTVFLPGDKPT